MEKEQIPESIIKHFDCKLLHKKIPYLTGKSKWDEVNKTWTHEIVYVCSECDKKD